MKISYTVKEIKALNAVTVKVLSQIGDAGPVLKAAVEMLQDANYSDAKLVELMDTAGYKFTDGCFVIEVTEEQMLAICMVVEKHAGTVARIWNIGYQLAWMVKDMVGSIKEDMASIFEK